MGCITRRFVRVVLTILFASSPAWAAPFVPPPPPPPPPPPTNPCVATDPIASIEGRAAQRDWTCGAVSNAFDGTASYSGGTYTTPATAAANCNEGVIVWNPYKACAYTIPKYPYGGAYGGKVYDKWVNNPQVRALVGYPAEDGIPVKTNPSQRFDYGHLANNAANSAAVIIGGRATMGNNHVLGKRFPGFSGGNPNAQLNSFLLAWAAYTGYTGGSVTSYKRPGSNTAYDPANGGGFLTLLDASVIGAANDATIAVKSGATAAYAVSGAIQDHWNASGGVGGYLRWPRSNNTAIPGGQYVAFEGTPSGGCTGSPCAFVYKSAAGTHAVEGQTLMHYQTLGGPGGSLGFPMDDPGPLTTFPRAQHFQGGAIVALAADFSYLLPGAVGHYWLQQGGGASFLGWPTQEFSYIDIATGMGYQHFERGTVCLRGSVAFGVEGAPLSPILAKYWSLGGPTGYLGHPTNTAPNSGTSIYPRTQTFQHGSITATSATTTSFEPHAPVALLILWGQEPTARTTQVTLSWQNRSAPQTLVRRRVGGGAWTTVQSYGELAYGTVTIYDAATTPDAENCFQVIGTDGTTQAPSPVRCVYTRNGRQIPVSRLQLRIRVPNGAVGGLWPQTDDWVQVRLQSPAWLEQWRPAGNSTWLDSSENDFELHSDKAYDLRISRSSVDMSAIKDMSDITQITVDVPTNDGLCIAEMELLIDERTAFKKVYGDATCAWAKNGTPVSVGFQELRNSADWDGFYDNIWGELRAPGLRQLIEGKFGNALHDQGGHLRDGHPTTYERIDETRAHMQVSMVVDDDWWGEVDATVDFDLVLVPDDDLGDPEPDPTRVRVENVDPSSQYGGLPILNVVVNLLFLPFFEYSVDPEIEHAIERMGGSTLGQPPAWGHYCFREGEAGLGLCTN